MRLFSSKYYQRLEDYFAGDESLSGLCSSQDNFYRAMLTGAQPTSFVDVDNQVRIGAIRRLIVKNRKTRRTILAIDTFTAHRLAAHFAEHRFDPQINKYYEIEDGINMFNLAKYNFGTIPNNAKEMIRQAVICRDILIEDLKRYEAKARIIDEQVDKEFRAYMKYSLKQKRLVHKVQFTDAKRYPGEMPLTYEYAAATDYASMQELGRVIEDAKYKG